MRKRKSRIDKMFSFLDYFFNGKYSPEEAIIDSYELPDGKQVKRISYPFESGNAKCIIEWPSTDDEPTLKTSNVLDSETMADLSARLRGYLEVDDWNEK